MPPRHDMLHSRLRCPANQEGYFYGTLKRRVRIIADVVALLCIELLWLFV